MELEELSRFNGWWTTGASRASRSRKADLTGGG
jgi:hypothetical protein